MYLVYEVKMSELRKQMGLHRKLKLLRKLLQMQKQCKGGKK